MALTTSFSLTFLATLSNVLDHGVATLPINFPKNLTFADGAAANQANMVWADQRTLDASATEDLDLAASLTHLLTGATLTFARIKGVLVKALAANTNNVNITRPAANGVPFFIAAGDGIAVVPDGIFVWMAPTAAGVAVTAGTGDLITFTNSAGGTPVTYDVVILGAAS